MKKLIIGSLVGGILVFLWQSLSWTVLNVHAKEYQKAPGEETILAALSSNLKEGQYILPGLEQGASSEEHKKMAESMKGKPWAVVNYHSAYDTDMVQNIIRGLLVSIVAAFCVCWVVSRNANSSFGNAFISCILIGLAGYLFIPYSEFIWFKTPGAMTHLIDVLLSWGLCGIWLGWWLKRR